MARLVVMTDAGEFVAEYPFFGPDAPGVEHDETVDGLLDSADLAHSMDVALGKEGVPCQACPLPLGHTGEHVPFPEQPNAVPGDVAARDSL
jgi:hypothetical protein